MTTFPQAPPPGLTVDGYTLLTRIGEGGMGVVHLARRGDGPRVALKVLRPHVVGGDEARARLAREVGSLSRIRSPRVAEIVDADPWGDIPYVATRYVPGLPLHDHVREEGPVAGADLVHLAGTLAEALAAVHSCGVLHRDVKPANVLMEGRSPVLIDFGLARLADDPKLTQTGWLLGTPGYLAPEILYGDEATTASDVHSWAATVAYAGLGRAPFGGGPGMAIMDRVRRGEHDLSGLPGPMRALLAAALDPDPAARPTVPELLRELAPVPATVDPAAARHGDPFTLPLAVAAQGLDPRRTGRTAAAEAGTAATEAGPRSTRAYTRHVPQPVDPGGEPGLEPRFEPGFVPGAEPGVERRQPARAPAGVRLRRSLLLVALALVGGAAVAAFPYVGTVALVLVAWLLRSGSLAGSAAGNRRLLRGRKWYDGAQTLLATPWHLVQSVPGTLALVLWSLGIGAAGALLGYAFAASTPVLLGVAGVMYAASLGLGPGGGRVRGPLRRVVRPLSRSLPVWFVVLLAVLAAAGLLGSLATGGPDWAPFGSSPLGLVR